MQVKNVDGCKNINFSSTVLMFLNVIHPFNFLSSAKLSLPKIMEPDSDHEYIQPKKTVHNESMMKEWENSEAYHVNTRIIFLV